MAPRALEPQIDGLYQLPLEEFTAARNTLAKGAGPETARIRALAKPPIGAWAVNQLHWRHRAEWDALIAAAENAQSVHRGVLAGRAGDVRAANRVHDEAVETALKTTVALLAKAGHSATDATRHAIGVTLRALPGDDPPGRLTRMLQPAGFETLAGLSVAAGAGRSHKPAAPQPSPAAPARKPVSRADAKALTQARQAAASAARVLRDAENAARREEFERVRTEREATRAEAALDAAGAAAKAAAAALKETEAAAARAAQLRDASKERAADAVRAVAKAKKDADAAAAALARAENSH